MRRRFGVRLWLRSGAVFADRRCGACFRLNWAVRAGLAGFAAVVRRGFHGLSLLGVFSAELSYRDLFGGFYGRDPARFSRIIVAGRCFRPHRAVRTCLAGFAAAVRSRFLGSSLLGSIRLNWAVVTCLAGLLPRSGAVFADYNCGACFRLHLSCRDLFGGFAAAVRCGRGLSLRGGVRLHWAVGACLAGFAAAVRSRFRGLSSLCVFRSR